MDNTATSQTRTWPLSAYVWAWCVHAFTMSGLLWVLLAARALGEGHYKAMWGWLIVSLIVDAIDGPLARKAKVQEVIPWFSGTMMDNVVDYMTWTFIPAVFMVKVIPLGPTPRAIIAAICALASSMFCYANTRMKSADWYFVGFPAAWNIVVLILWLFHSGPIVNWLVVIVFTILAVVPWKWLHPFRVKKYRAINAVAAIIWVTSTAIMVWTFPHIPMWLRIPWWISGIWILGVSALRTWRGRPDRPNQRP